MLLRPLVPRERSRARNQSIDRSLGQSAPMPRSIDRLGSRRRCRCPREAARPRAAARAIDRFIGRLGSRHRCRCPRETAGALHRSIDRSRPAHVSGQGPDVRHLEAYRADHRRPVNERPPSARLSECATRVQGPAMMELPRQHHFRCGDLVMVMVMCARRTYVFTHWPGTHGVRK